jgi:hypothetical protein
MQTGEAKRPGLRPTFCKLQLKEFAVAPIELLHESQQSSVFGNISGIQRIPSSGISFAEVVETKNVMVDLVSGTDQIGDLIIDGKTQLVFKEKVIHTSSLDIVNQRYIIYQKGETEGRIIIKESNHTNRIDDEEDEEEPFTFRQCSFYFCDTRHSFEGRSQSYFEGIQILCSSQVKFVDCSFIGISYGQAGTKTTGVPYKVFTDMDSAISLELQNCYISGMIALLKTNLPVKRFKMHQCTLDRMEGDSLVLTHPTKVVIAESHFLNCMGNTINIKIFEDEHPEKSVKRMSVFANSTRVENSVVE